MGLFSAPVRDREYLVEGERYPSVTDCLGTLGLQVFPPQVTREMLDAAAHRGTMVHRYSAIIDRHGDGALDWDTIDVKHIGYLEGFEHFRHDHLWVPELIEQSMFHPLYRFAGTVDRTGKLAALKEDERAVLDIKTGVPMEAHALQLSGYQLLLDTPAKYRRFGLYLNDDGTYRLKEYENAQDRTLFLYAVALTHWKLTHGAFKFPAKRRRPA